MVIALVGILAALLLPALGGAKDAAKSAACKSNLRQLGIALASYTHDEEFHPPLKHGDRWSGYGWQGYLLRYTANNRSVFRCPATSPDTEWTMERSSTGFEFPHNVDQWTPFSYGYNGWGAASASRYGLGVSEGTKIPAGRVLRPDDMIAIADTDGNRIVDAEIGFYKPPGMTRPISSPGGRHKDGPNVLFCDGHIEWAKLSKWLERTDAAARRWNNDNQSHPEIWRR